MSYARFYKCDLHMHSPLDSHWRDENTRLKPDDSDERKTEIARQYLRACHTAGLEVIAITDHNFAPGPDHSFIKWLCRENESVAADPEVNQPPLVIFPGFEIEAKVGKGCHILCLFSPDTPLEIVDARLTLLHLSPERRYGVQRRPLQSDCDLPTILKIVQEDSQYPGIVIAPHPFDGKGFLSNKMSEMWLQEMEWRNSELMAMEIPKPFDELPPGLQKLLRNGNDCLPEWQRERPIAYVLSSDTFRLTADPEQPGNYIGYRHTWIKMSRPSIESLRQAFLDHTSRIRFGPKSPEQNYIYPKIRRVRVQNAAFLRNLDWLEWSPNFNCLIGSRGTGKSTLLDYMRLALDRLRREDIPPSLFDEVEARAKGTLTQDTRIEVDIETRGGTYRVVYTGAGQREVYEEYAEIPNAQLDVRVLFPCRILSQREIDHSIERRDRTALRRFLDDFLRRDLEDLAVQEKNVRGNIQQIEAEVVTKQAGQERRVALETERRDLQNRLDKQQKLKELLPRWQSLVTERDFFNRLFEESKILLEGWRERLEDLELRATLLEADLQTSPNAAVIAATAQAADAAIQTLRQIVGNALNDFERAIQTEDSLPQKEYQQWVVQYENVHKQVEAAQLEAGADAQAIDEIPQRILSLKNELDILEREREAIAALEQKRTEKLAELRRIWRDQTQLRQNQAETLMQQLRPTPGAKPYVEIRIVHQGDIEETVKAISRHIKNKTRLNESDIRELIEQYSPSDETPYIQCFFEEARQDPKGSVFQALSKKRQDAFCEFFNEPALRQLELERIPDAINYYVYRQDGTLAGPIENVSAGQQGTAILNLLLAAGDEPLLVDTPEEGLDNEGVYAELVPLFRREKERRQIILVTHNANLPVNADAEGIVALEAAGWVPADVIRQALTNTGYTLNDGQIQHLEHLVRWSDWGLRLRMYLQRQQWSDQTIESFIEILGRSRAAEGRFKLVDIDNTPLMAVGALDNPAVKHAVQDIMEGSEKAFRRRWEKYGF